jgi:hypothetical protein
MKKYYVRCGKLLRVGLAESPRQAAETVIRSNLDNNGESKMEFGTTIYVTEHGFTVFSKRRKHCEVWRWQTLNILKKLHEAP